MNKFVPQYRRAFYEGLKARMDRAEVTFDLVYGDPAGDDAKKGDSIAIEWATRIPNVAIGPPSVNVSYQPVLKLALSYDLVVVEQANKLLVNPVLMAMNKLGLIRLAFWGHGKDFQGEANIAMRALKRALLPQVFWWFAYNEMSADVVRGAGFPNERITRIMNTIDGDALTRDLSDVTDAQIDAERLGLGITGRNVAVYLGGMYDKKRLPFLLSACEAVRREIPDFEMIFLGSGADRHIVDEFCSNNRWAISCGPTFGPQKARYLRLAKLLLMPGLVGLAIIDAFIAEVPIVTTNVAYHSPEIDYLKNDINGVMVQACDDVEAFAAEIVRLLVDDKRLANLRAGCRAAAKTYTMNNMVDHVADGILAALAT